MHSDWYKPNDNLSDEYKKMLEALISEEAVEKQLGSGNVNANVTAWSNDMEGPAKIAEGCFESAHKKIEQLHKSRHTLR